jgi:hypothetical protein
MQNRYVVDIGNYLKLGILRALLPGYLFGVAWWLFSDEAHNGDGRHIGYLNRPEQRRLFDPDLFDILLGVVSSGQRNVKHRRRLTSSQEQSSLAKSSHPMGCSRSAAAGTLRVVRQDERQPHTGGHPARLIIIDGSA